MVFFSPAYLWLLSIVPIFAAASVISIRGVVAWHDRFAGVRKRALGLYLRTLLLSLAILAVSLALARPGVRYTRTVFNRGGIDLVVGLDVSKSMLAEDTVLPAGARRIFPISNRLNRARQFTLDVLSSLRGERIGIFLFASQGVEVVPLTTDYGFCRYILTYINAAEITVPGSDLGQAIRTAISIFQVEGEKAARVLVLVSDGEDTRADPSFLSESAILAARAGIRIFTVGVGTGRGVLIPARSEDGSTIVSYYMDEEGNHLKTRLEKGTLEEISQITGGGFFKASDQRAPGELVEAILKVARHVEYTRSTEQAWLGLSPFFLAAGLLFLSAGVWVGR